MRSVRHRNRESNALFSRGIQSETPHMRTGLSRVLATPPLPSRFSSLAILLAEGFALAGANSYGGNYVDDGYAFAPSIFRFLVCIASGVLRPSFGWLAVRPGRAQGERVF